MLFGTYQPTFRANANPAFQSVKDAIAPHAGSDVPPQDFRGSRPDPLEAIIGFRPIWCFPANTLQEALTHGLLTAPNTSDLFFLIESDDFVRVDKVRHYAAIARDGDRPETFKSCIRPDCPDVRRQIICEGNRK